MLEDALSEYLERHQSERPRAHVLEAFGLSMQEFDELYKDLIEEAAALLESLAINHPFIDSNKRIAFHH